MNRLLLAVCALLLAAPSAFARGGGGRASMGFRGGSRGFSRPASRPSFGRSTAFAHSSSFRPSARPAAFRAAARTSFRPAAAKNIRRATSSDSTPPAWTTIGAKIVSAGQPPVYSQAAGGGTHSVEGGGFVAMDQSKAQDVGRSPGISWGPADTTPSGARGGAGGGSGGSSNGPAFDPSF